LTFKQEVIMEKTIWRVLQTPPAPGPWNMALDEAILEAVGQNNALPTLRLFAWQPACLSLGYAQTIKDVDRHQLTLLGWDLVRRPTGGRAILHTDELTYSVIAPLHEPRVYGSILESYRRLSQALLCALSVIGLEARAEKDHPGPEKNSPVGPVCFEIPSNYEITVSGKKLIGSAQARRREGVLQHGSLPLYGDLTRIVQGLEFASESLRQSAANRLLARAVTVEACLGRQVTWQETAQAFVTGFEQALDIQLIPAEPTAAELERTSQLVISRYSHPDWTNRV
jgi:lipoate-protein ligase A